MITAEVMQKFCATDRPGLNEPWVKDGHKYAVNGHIGIRIPCDEADSLPPDDAKFPSAYKLGWMSDGETCEFPKNSVTRIIKQCPDCKGTRKINDTGSCDYCGHTCSHAAECRNCDDGVVSEIEPENIIVGQALIASEYMLKIMELPNPRYIVNDEKGIITFVFDGGQGLLMALNRDR